MLKFWLKDTDITDWCYIYIELAYVIVIQYNVRAIPCIAFNKSITFYGYKEYPFCKHIV